MNIRQLLRTSSCHDQMFRLPEGVRAPLTAGSTVQGNKANAALLAEAGVP